MSVPTTATLFFFMLITSILKYLVEYPNVVFSQKVFLSFFEELPHWRIHFSMSSDFSGRLLIIKCHEAPILPVFAVEISWLCIEEIFKVAVEEVILMKRFSCWQWRTPSILDSRKASFFGQSKNSWCHSFFSCQSLSEAIYRSGSLCWKSLTVILLFWKFEGRKEKNIWSWR